MAASPRGALAVVAVACTYAGFVFDARRFPLDPDRGKWYDRPNWGFWGYAAGILGSFAACLVVIGAAYTLIVAALVWRKSVSGLDVWNPLAMFTDQTHGRQYYRLPLGILGGLAYSVAVGSLCYGAAWVLARRGTGPGEESGGAAAPADPAPVAAAGPTAERSGWRRVRWLWLGGRDDSEGGLALWLLGAFLGTRSWSSPR